MVGAINAVNWQPRTIHLAMEETMAPAGGVHGIPEHALRGRRPHGLPGECLHCSEDDCCVDGFDGVWHEACN